LKILSASQAIPVHIISGFLGAGKTTLLKHLLQQKPEQEIWAVLMNEFGQIGVDQQLLPQDQGYAVKELLGGCLCCSSQLPMQIALSRLLSEVKPDRLFIEPTGLGHPGQLLEQLTEPHWQSHLNMQALVTVVDGSRLHDRDWTDSRRSRSAHAASGRISTLCPTVAVHRAWTTRYRTDQAGLSGFRPSDSAFVKTATDHPFSRYALSDSANALSLCRKRAGLSGCGLEIAKTLAIQFL